MSALEHSDIIAAFGASGFVGQFEFDWLPELKTSQATSIQHR
jgi:hypothetical protein